MLNCKNNNDKVLIFTAKIKIVKLVCHDCGNPVR